MNPTPEPDAAAEKMKYPLSVALEEVIKLLEVYRQIADTDDERIILLGAIRSIKAAVQHIPASPDVAGEQECSGCEGTGELTEPIGGGFTSCDCPLCNGTGKVSAPPPEQPQAGEWTVDQVCGFFREDCSSMGAVRCRDAHNSELATLRAAVAEAQKQLTQALAACAAKDAISLEARQLIATEFPSSAALQLAKLEAIKPDSTALDSLIADRTAELGEKYAQLESRCYEGLPSASDGIFDALKEADARTAELQRENADNRDAILLLQTILKDEWQQGDDVECDVVVRILNQRDALRQRLETAEADAKRLSLAARAFLDNSQSLAASHPHLAAYCAHSQEEWTEIRLALGPYSGKKE